MTHRVHALAPGDPWPPALSDGLASRCPRCDNFPRFDYQVDDETWQQLVPEEWRTGVVCLPCLDQMAMETGGSLSGKIRMVSFAGGGFVTEFIPAISYDFSEWRDPEEPNDPEVEARLWL